MMIASCPKCHESVTIPGGAPEEAIVRCPLCMAEYALAEALAKLPPRLVILSTPAAPAAQAEVAPVAMLAGVGALGVEHAAEPAPESVDELAASWETPEVPEAPEAMFGEPGEELADVGDGDIALAEAEVTPVSPSSYAFEEAAAPSAASGPAVVARPRAKKKSGGGFLQLVGVIGGGLMAAPLAQLLLWWAFPGDWSRDMGLGPTIAKVEWLRWMVPEKFQGHASQKVAEGAQLEQPAPTIPAAVEHKPEAKSPDKSDELLAQALKANQEKFNGQGTGAGGEKNPGPDLRPGNNKTPAAVNPDDAFNSPPKLPTDPAVEPPTIPEPEIKVDVKPAVVPEKVVDPFGVEGTKPAPKVEPKPAVEVPVEPKPETKPGLKLAGALFTADAASVLKNAAEVKPADLGQALTAANEVDKLWDALAADAPKEEKGKVAREMRTVLATLGEAATFQNAAAAQNGEPARHTQELLEHLAASETKLQVVAVGAAGWLASSTRTSNGVTLAGTVKEVKAAGEVFETQVELLTPKGGTLVSVLGKQDLSGTLAAGTRVMVLGVIVDNPSANVTGYQGSAPQAVWGGQFVALPAAEKAEK